MAAPLLAIDGLIVNISTSHGLLRVVRNVSLSVERGETLCLVGESGCGKSMTALALMGILPRSAIRSARRFVFEGENLLVASEKRLAELRGARMAMVFQDPMTAFNPAYTIGEQLAEVYRYHKGSTRRAACDRAVELLEK